MTKFCILSPDKKGTIDPTVHNILSQMPGLGTYEQADVVLVPITRLDNFEFNTELWSLLKGKPWVLIDYCEYGWDWDRKETHFFGLDNINPHGCCQFPAFNSKEWWHIDAFMHKNPPIVYFKRELLEKDRTSNIHPIEYPCFYPDEYPIQSQEEFDARPIEVISYWGLSHEVRMNVHGSMFNLSGKLGYYMIDNWYNIEKAFKNESNPKKWASIYCPHFSRIDMREVIQAQSMSKMTLSLEGAGIKCFRHAEAPINSVMVLRDDTLAWSYPWVHNYNCIRLKSGDNIEAIKGTNAGREIVEQINSHTNREDLYDIYLRGYDNMSFYRLNRYLISYVIPIIKKAL